MTSSCEITRQSGTLVGAPQWCPLGHILTSSNGSQPQYAHLRASKLAYSHINLLSMLARFEPKEAVRVATDSIYVQKTSLHKLELVEAYVAPKQYNCNKKLCISCLKGDPFLPQVGPAQWRDKGEQLCMPQEHAAYLPKPEYCNQAKPMAESTAPRYDDPLTRHLLSYLNGGGGRGETTRAIELFRATDPVVFTPTHLLPKEM